MATRDEFINSNLGGTSLPNATKEQLGAIYDSGHPATTTTPTTAPGASPSYLGYMDYSKDPNGTYVSSPNNGGTQTPQVPLGTALGDYGITAEDPTVKAARDFAAQEANVTFDPDKIKADTLASFQSEIDSLKSVYANKLKEVQQQGANRLGQVGVGQARTGLIGSGSQQQQNAGVISNNNDIEQSVNDELNAKISDVLSKANSDAATAIANARAAKIAGGDKYVSEITSRNDLKNTNISNVAKQLIANGVDPSQLSESDQQSLLDTFAKSGFTDVTYNDIKTAYKAEAASQKAASDKATKDSQTTLAEGATLVGPDGKVVASGATKPVTLAEGAAYFDPVTGKVIYKNPKTTASGSDVPGADSTSLGTTSPTGVKIPDALAPYYKTSYNGLGYADLSSLSKSDQAKVAQLAVANGLTPVYDTATSSKLNAISDANTNLAEIQKALATIKLGEQGTVSNIPGLGNGSVKQGVENTISKFFGNSDLKSFNAFRTAIINNVQALAGGAGSGLRINQAEINAAMENDLPVVTGAHADTPESAKAKLQRLTKQLNAWEQQLVGGGVHAGQDVTVGQNGSVQPQASSTMGLTVTDPNGGVHTFPDQKAADAFKKAAGIQ